MHFIYTNTAISSTVIDYEMLHPLNIKQVDSKSAAVELKQF